jgi:transcriptional regulator with XRE-family HTH domain
MSEIFSPQNIHQQLARRIRLLRVSRGWSQEVLAELAGLHRNYIGHVERAEVNIGLANLAKIAHAFEIPVHELLKMEEPANPGYFPRTEEAAGFYLCAWA